MEALSILLSACFTDSLEMVESAELDLYMNRYQTSHHISLVFARLQTVTLVLSAMPFERHFPFSITSLGSSIGLKTWNGSQGFLCC